MGRPSKNTNIEDEKRLTFAVCQLIFSNSGLTFSELEDVFAIGTISASGKKTGKTFSRYCTPDPEKSRAATRNDLKRFAKVAIENDWITSKQVKNLCLDSLLQLSNPKRVGEVFAERKKEIEDLVGKFDKLRVEIEKAQTALHAAKYFRYHQARIGAALNRSNAMHKVLWDGQVYLYTDENGHEIVAEVPEGSYIHESVPFALASLLAHLGDSKLILNESDISIGDALNKREIIAPPGRKNAALSKAQQVKLADALDDLVNGLQH